MSERPGNRFAAWLLNDPTRVAHLSDAERARLDPARVVPFVALHLGCVAVLWVGVSPVAVAVALALYLARMFVITAFYHRYFSHRAFRTSRAMQLAMAILGCTAGQRGPLWWAAHHREHHLQSDSAEDPHSPAHRGRLWAHTGWFLTRGSFAVKGERVRDWMRFPELRWVERLDWVPFLALAAACYGLGDWLAATRPELATSGGQMLVWGFLVSTTALYHGTYTVNSFAHGFGYRLFDTADDSRNNAWVALLTLGEGWHNNHHHYPVSARQGFRWWEVDPSYWALRALAALGLVRDLNPVPARVLAEAQRGGAR